MIPARPLGAQADKNAMHYADQGKMDGLVKDLKSSHF